MLKHIVLVPSFISMLILVGARLVYFTSMVLLIAHRYSSDSNIIRYAKIAMQLQNKTVRDVALRCRWMSVCPTIFISLQCTLFPF